MVGFTVGCLESRVSDTGALVIKNKVTENKSEISIIYEKKSLL